MTYKNEFFDWPPRFRQDELAGMIMPGPDPAYLVTARELARAAALAEAISEQVNAYPLLRELSVLHIEYLKEYLVLSGEVDTLSREIGANAETVRELARIEVGRLATATCTHPDYEAYAEAHRIIRKLPNEREEAALIPAATTV